MKSFTYQTPAVRVVFEPGALTTVADEAIRFGARRVLLLASPFEAHWANVVAEGLGDRLAGRFDEVTQHVPITLAERAVARAKEASADLLIPVGGGSTTGLAKAVAKELGTPILAVPTTYAGSEMTPIWGLTGDDGKLTGRDSRVAPQVVVYDPELTVSLPAGLTATSGLNAMAHCVEALYAPNASPVTVVVAEEGVRILAAGLPRCLETPDDLDARSDVLCGAWLAGWSLGTATMGLHHRLCHVLGGRFDLPHAATHAVVLPYATAYVRDAAPEAMARLARALGPDGSPDPARDLRQLASTLGVPTSLSAVGMPADGVAEVVEDVLAKPPASPRPIVRGALTVLLEQALGGLDPEPPPS